jgi:hypothetical protein
MTPEDIELIHRYLDDQIDADEIEHLESRLRESVDLRQTLVQASLLDDQLWHVLAKGSDLERQNDSIALAGAPGKTKVRSAPSRPVVAFVAGSIFLLVGLLLLSNRNQLSASQEFNRILKSLSKGDRLYSINVEEMVLPSRKQREKYDSTRPPKPTLDGAKLYVRGLDQFVLMRFRDEGAVFVTGSDGQIGWAIAPSGPVRISRDTQRFNRDLPGHEHSIPLGNLSQGLEQIKKAYTVEIVTATPSEQLGEQEAVLIAIKKPGERGPKRIEIQYGKQSGRIAQIRFIEMPYGPDRLTVRLTLTDELSLPSPFFHHSHHQASDREVIDEDKEQE